MNYAITFVVDSVNRAVASDVMNDFYFSEAKSCLSQCEYSTLCMHWKHTQE